VYNLEVESRDGQITHNYFVGEEELWVHNAQRGAGPNKKPKLHFPKFKSRKCAEQTACNAPGSCGAIHHANPKRGRPHYHPKGPDEKPIKDGVHYTY